MTPKSIDFEQYRKRFTGESDESDNSEPEETQSEEEVSDPEYDSIYNSQPASNNTVVWQRAGTSLQNAQTVREALSIAGLNWDVATRPVFTLDNDMGESSLMCLESQQAVIRTDTNTPLALVGQRYVPIPNYTAFKILDEIQNEVPLQYEYAGNLDGGKYVWLLAKLAGEDEILHDDVLNRYILILTNHTGACSLELMLTFTRLQCMNQLTTARASSGGNRFKIKHNQNAGEAIAAMSNVLSKATTEYEQSVNLYRRLAAKDISSQTVKDLNKLLLPPDQDGQYTPRMKNKMARIFILFEGSGKGAQIAGRTLWGWYNAVCETIDYPDSTRSDEKLFSSNIWGNGYWLKMQALQVAMQYL